LREAFTATMAIGDERGYTYFAGLHGLPRPMECTVAHGRPFFLPWHRAYLYFFERALRDQVPDAMLTWWDWRTPTIPAIAAGSFSVHGTDPLAVTSGAPTAAPTSDPPRSEPVHVDIPRIGVDAEVVPVGLNPDGTVGVPPLDTGAPLGWYRYLAAPGDPGPAVLLGHVDTYEGPAVFYRIHEFATR